MGGAGYIFKFGHTGQLRHQEALLFIISLHVPGLHRLLTVVSCQLRHLFLLRHAYSALGASFVAMCRAESIAFLDDDDEWLPNKLERQIAFPSPRL
jgi:hypothetical protein